MYPGVARTSGKAIGSLIAPIAGFAVGIFCLCIPAPIGGIVGIILGRSARSDIKRSGGTETGEGLATAGEIIGWVVTVLGVLGIAAFVILTLAGNQLRDVFCNISNGLGSTP
jgi:hypothetical protein